ncbi:MAG: hypothetical protein ACLP5V_15815 [Candidatus Bathyarchaeia archaeon]
MKDPTKKRNTEVERHPIITPRRKSALTRGPSDFSINTLMTVAYTGNGVSRPLKRGPNIDAAPVISRTNPVAAIIRVGISHLAEAREIVPEAPEGNIRQINTRKATTPLGAVITTEVQAFLGLITAANPLSWLWPFVNLVFAVVVGTVSVVLSKLHARMKLRTRLLLLSLTCALVDIPMTYVVIVLALGLPFTFYLVALPIYITLQLVPSTLISYAILRGILRAHITGSTL